MANRFIKSSIWTSPTLNRTTDDGEILFYRLLPLPDDHGCFLADPRALVGQLFPLKPAWTATKVATALTELVRLGIINLWVAEDRLWGVFLTWSRHQQIRSHLKRKTPVPPAQESGEFNNSLCVKYLAPFDISCNQLISTDISCCVSSLFPLPSSLLPLQKEEEGKEEEKDPPQKPALPVKDIPPTPKTPVTVETEPLHWQHLLPWFKANLHRFAEVQNPEEWVSKACDKAIGEIGIDWPDLQERLMDASAYLEAHKKKYKSPRGFYWNQITRMKPIVAPDKVPKSHPQHEFTAKPWFNEPITKLDP